MFKKKCRDCGRKIGKDFNFCPYCGMSFKSGRDGENFGMIGRDDDGVVEEEMKMPFGLGKVMNSLMKQLEKEMSVSEFGDGNSRGIQIRVSHGFPQMKRVVQNKPKERVVEENVSEEEKARRIGLPKVEGKSKIRRLADRIVYEIETPGVRGKKDVVVTRLETGLEVRAFSKDKCYIKSIPLKVEMIGFSVGRDRVFVELKS